VPHIGEVQARLLVQHFGSAEAIFRARKSELEKIEGMGSVRAKSTRDFKAFDQAEKELLFTERFGIQPLFLTDAAYPHRLLQCTDAPTLLFYKGTADLNASKVVAIVGTRNHTEYGKSFTEQQVKDLAEQQVLVVSGLAYGIDAIARKAAMKYALPTVGVVGHGLDKMYPAENATLTREMVKAGGGLLTEFFSGTGPEKHNFPLRNAWLPASATRPL